jgi:hypothetical protein
MALFKPFRGQRTDLDNVTKIDGYAYFCIDDGTFWIDYKDGEEVKRKQINKEDWTKDIEEAVAALKSEIEGRVTTATFNITEANTTIRFKNLTGMTHINWGDGTVNSELSHTYVKVGEYECKIYDATTIGYEAFCDCSSLTSIVIPDGVTSIGGYAFNSCTSLTSIVIPDSVTSIGDVAFAGCSSLTSVVIPDGVTSIGEGAFYRCSKLENITIGKNVSSIGKRTFSNCPALRHLTLKSKAPTSFSDYVEYIYYGPTNHEYFGEHDFDDLNSIFVPPGYVDVYKQDIFYALNKDLTQSESTELSDHLDSIIKPDPEVLQMEYTDNLRNGEGKSALLQADSDCQTTGDFGVSFGFGGKYPGRSDAPVETYRVLKALSDIGEPVYFEYSTTKWQLTLKNKKEDCVDLYDAYQHDIHKNEIYVLTDVENRSFSRVGIQDCYSYVGVNKGKASLTAGAKYYNDARYSSVFGTQNIVGDNQEQTYNDLVSGSFNIVRSEKNSIIGGKFNNALNGQFNIISGTENSVQNATTSIIGGRNGNFKDFYNSIGVGYWLEGSGDGKAIFGRTNIDNPNALLIVGNGNETGRSNAFEVHNDGRVKSYVDLSKTQLEDNDLVTVAFMKQYIKDNFATLLEEYFANNQVTFDGGDAGSHEPIAIVGETTLV